MLSRSLNKVGVTSLASRSLSSGAVKVADAGVQGSSQSKPPVKFQPELKISRLSNSLMVSSLDTIIPTSRVSLVFRAGTRYENEHNLGMAHRLCAQVGLGSNKNSTLGTVVNAGMMGAQLKYHLSRDLISFEMEMSRELITDGLMLLGDIICRPALRFWEFDHTEPHMMEQVKQAKADPQKRVFDLVHKAAFRNQGLGNPLTSPEYMVGKHEPEMLREYHDKFFLSGEGGVVAQNVDHEGLLTFCTDFLPIVEGKAGLAEKSQFYSGEERRNTGGSTATVVIAGEGSSVGNMKEQATYAVMSHCLGGGELTPWSDHMGLGLIGKNASGKPCKANTVSFSHADTGVFGVYVTGDSVEMRDSIFAAVAPLKSLASAPLSDADISNAKAAAVTKTLVDAESEDQYNGLVSQTMLGGEFGSPPELVELIKSVTAIDVQTAAKKVASKLAMGAVGDLSHTPYLDEIQKL